MVWLELFNFIHFIGLAFGLGGATIAAIISRKADRDKDIAIASMKIMPSISRLIVLGLIFLIISGIALPFFIKWPLNKEMLVVKHILVILIVVFGMILGKNSKKISKLAPRGNEKPSQEFLKIKKKIKIISLINLILWYLTTILSEFI
jgi:uncharacterized membrane protein